jgi:hypothetical protein
MPNPMLLFEPRALSNDRLDLADLTDLVGLGGVFSLFGVESRVSRSVLMVMLVWDGDMIKESPGREGSIALLRCQNNAGDSGLVREVWGSSSVLELVLDSLEAARLDVRLSLCLSLSPSRLPRGLADVW